MNISAPTIPVSPYTSDNFISLFRFAFVICEPRAIMIVRLKSSTNLLPHPRASSSPVQHHRRTHAPFSACGKTRTLRLRILTLPFTRHSTCAWNERKQGTREISLPSRPGCRLPIVLKYIEGIQQPILEFRSQNPQLTLIKLA